MMRTARHRPRRSLILLLTLVLPLAALAGLSLTSRSATADTTNDVPAAPSGWQTVFSDDFNGPAGSSLDTTNWLYDTGTGYSGGAANWGTGEVESYTNSTSNVFLDGNGHLVIKPTKDASGNWTSGRVETQRTDWTAPAGGEMEMSASIEQPNPANGLGYWPAFWAMGAPARAAAATNWPSIGELDTMEDVNALSQTSATMHCGTDPGGPCNENFGITSNLQTCSGCQADYHTYSVIVDRTNTSAEQVRYYLDGVQTFAINESQVDTATWQAAVDHGFFAIFNVAMGGSYPNRICACTSPSAATTADGQMSVDWFAVYQTPNPNAQGRSTLESSYASQGYAYGVNKAPASNADLVHVKIREGHTHTLTFRPFGPQGNLLDDYTVKAKEGYNAWFDPSKVSRVEITMSSGHPPVNDRVDGNHCYYEDEDGNLRQTTHGSCNAK